MTDSPLSALPTLCLVRDLMFASKISVAAARAGVTTVEVVREPRNADRPRRLDG